MSEKTPDTFEQKVEHIPTPDEVSEIIRQMVGGEFQETKRCLDAKGNLYRIDAIAPGTREGESLEIFYIRKGVYPSGDQAAETEIHSVYVGDDYCGPAGPQASLADGQWVLTS
ncbi:MAG: hypothetical protein UW46_C0006G0043 [Candidatus Yanofskybacteria bacterium GW2011_GWF1_44_227]|uniref:Uncharacterized protein n=1 Tax=Candidatus Yanofskybacteria bacterium GW2011_GWE2_40_11 TaxID=1619033 RepID=A0A0G0T034_9BACT|nr:MAG: hypothetical protein UT69_C0002G0038 [Candidatus Yanofskybacteria bacterium GW2011_GWE1_40_10]KKR40490.1 MAG: hypothetical protein UT75_C0008G0012 [Candidatus Yanofskybacteria bacterium GW2011_GWE2_40_11]KKT15442.1 MAG: hypothetical protein UV97_C0006G0009 [Candidatus Yanofskybacteria bacterium GW2011_GWF2_43_596]KKT53142.1 MAG: hypothetical protein UW46_C0006G0043 [Candidatus Yanofskybacteria bacterium GW2011_GWF1_44_227]OGN35509.1 MAG: hypothetical protein A2207_02095 [Candidatus Yano